MVPAKECHRTIAILFPVLLFYKDQYHYKYVQHPWRDALKGVSGAPVVPRENIERGCGETPEAFFLQFRSAVFVFDTHSSAA